MGVFYYPHLQGISPLQRVQIEFFWMSQNFLFIDNKQQTTFCDIDLSLFISYIIYEASNTNFNKYYNRERTS